jgi:N-acetylglucosaminyldiphosphoundecaprenol N-acetyl-beta-D-mannosaminyltransferase
MLPVIEFSPFTLRETVRAIETLVRSGQRHYVCFCEANLFVNAWRNADTAAALRGASMVLADGVSVLLLARLRGQHIPKRVPGPMVLPTLCEHGTQAGLRHFFLGGQPGVADRLAERFRTAYPGIAIVGTYSPPFHTFTPEDDAEIRRRVEDARPDLLWVALGAPRQELWMAAQRNKLSVPVMLGVGAAFDFHAGTRPWAPLWVRHLGMEWAFRMATGGPRILFRNLRCVSMMVLALAGTALTSRRPRAAGLPDTPDATGA